MAGPSGHSRFAVQAAEHALNGGSPVTVVAYSHTLSVLLHCCKRVNGNGSKALSSSAFYEKYRYNFLDPGCRSFYLYG